MWQGGRGSVVHTEDCCWSHDSGADRPGLAAAHAVARPCSQGGRRRLPLPPPPLERWGPRGLGAPSINLRCAHNCAGRARGLRGPWIAGMERWALACCACPALGSIRLLLARPGPSLVTGTPPLVGQSHTTTMQTAVAQKAFTGAAVAAKAPASRAARCPVVVRAQKEEVRAGMGARGGGGRRSEPISSLSVCRRSHAPAAPPAPSRCPIAAHAIGTFASASPHARPPPQPISLAGRGPP